MGTFYYLKSKDRNSNKVLSSVRVSEATNVLYDETLSLGTSKFCSCLSGSELSHTFGGNHAFMTPKRNSRVSYLHLHLRMFEIVLNIYPIHKKEL